MDALHLELATEVRGPGLDFFLFPTELTGEEHDGTLAVLQESELLEGTNVAQPIVLRPLPNGVLLLRDVSLDSKVPQVER